MSETGRICSRCHHTWSPEHTVCPEDGGQLFSVEADVAKDRCGEVIDGKVTILGLLGIGGMGAVYRALQHSMEREVAVKVLHRTEPADQTIVLRFLREAKSASRLNHPHIVTLFDFGQSSSGELYLLMELLEGRDLASVIEEERGLQPVRAADIAIQICDAMQHAHDNGIVHRDMKPENVFLLHSLRGSGDFAKVLDFGIAKSQVLTDAEHLTMSGTVCGTPAYMSPEQAVGDDIDGRSDVYAIGVVLYEMLTGRLPFDEETPVKIILAHIQRAPLKMSPFRADVDIPPALEAVVMSALAKKPADRPQSAAALAKMLSDAVSGRPVTLDRPRLKTTGRSHEPVQPLAPTLGVSRPTPSWESPAATGGSTGVGLLGGNTESDAPIEALPAEPEASPPSITETLDRLPVARKRSAWPVVALLLAIALGGTWWALTRPPEPEPRPGSSAPPVAAGGTSTAAVQPPPTPAPSPTPVKRIDKTVPSPPPARVTASRPEEPETVAVARGLAMEPASSRMDLAIAIPAVPPAALEVRMIRVKTRPKGASVFDGKRLLGKAPIEVSAGEAARQLTFRLAGHRQAKSMVGPESEDEVVVRLKKAGRRPPKPKSGGDFVPVQ